MSFLSMAEVTAADVRHLWPQHPGNREDCGLRGAQESWAVDQKLFQAGLPDSSVYPQFQCQPLSVQASGNECIVKQDS